MTKLTTEMHLIDAITRANLSLKKMKLDFEKVGGQYVLFYERVDGTRGLNLYQGTKNELWDQVVNIAHVLEEETKGEND